MQKTFMKFLLISMHGLSNYHDISKLPNVLHGMIIKGKVGNFNKDCNRGNLFFSVIELVHIGLADPIEPTDINGYTS